MKLSKLFVIKLCVWSCLMLYVLADLFVFKGPLQKSLRPKVTFTPESDKQRGIVARVFNRPIYLSQVDFAVDQRLWEVATTRSKVAPETIQSHRYAALRNIIDQYLLREKVRLHQKEFPISATRIDAALEAFKKRFETRKDYVDALKYYGFKAEGEFRKQLEAKIQQQDYIRHKMETALAVPEEQVRQWYEDHHDQLALPERWLVRHIFLPKLHYTEKKAVDILQKAAEALAAGETDFAQLAAELSMDDQTKDKGGELGWVHHAEHRQALPSLVVQFTDLPLHTPSILKSSIGWHLIELKEHQDTRAPEFEEVREQIELNLQNSIRREAIERYRASLRKQHANSIRVYWEHLGYVAK